MTRLVLALCTLALASAQAVAQNDRSPAAIRPGDPSLSPGRVTTGADTLRVSITRGARTLDVGTMVLTTARVESDGGALLVRTERMEIPAMASPDAEGPATDSFALAAATLAPAWASSGGVEPARLVYVPGRVSGTVRTDDEVAVVDVALDGGVFHGNATDVVLRALPLAEGWIGAWHAYHGGGPRPGVTRARVAGGETRTTRRGESVAAWRVEVEEDGKSSPSVYWIPRDGGPLLRFESALPSGALFILAR